MRRALKTRSTQIVLALATGAAFAVAPSWTPDLATINKLEASPKLKGLPKWNDGHQPVVAEYERFYYGYLIDGHQMIRGELVIPLDSKTKPAGVYVISSEKEFPIMMDGGCRIMHLVYDVEKAQIVSLKCNGYA